MRSILVLRLVVLLASGAARGDETHSKATPAAADVASARAETREKIKRLEADRDRAGSPQGKELLKEFAERLRWLSEWDKVAADRREVEHPEGTQAPDDDELKADLERTRASLDQAAKDPTALLPEIFRNASGKVSDAAMEELKEAIDAAGNEVKDKKAAMDAARPDAPSAAAGKLAERRAKREEVRQHCATLATRKGERAADLAAASTAEARELARERLANFDWEARVESARLQCLDAQIARETRHASLADLEFQARKACWTLATRTLEQMQARYQGLVDRQQRDLQRAAAIEQARADRTKVPLERYRAKRAAELLDLQALLLKDKRALAADPSPSLQEETELAERAKEDFRHLKQLFDGGRSTSLVAVRLNNNFRRLCTVRENVVRNELTAASNVLTQYENALTDVELDLLNDSRDDRFVLDALLEALPPAQRGEALKLAEGFEVKHHGLLEERRRVLEKLAARAEQSRGQILRRLQTLDEQHAFIRTRIFWLRDCGPIGPEMFDQARRESRHLARAVLRVATDPGSRTPWKAPSAEFGLALLGVIVLPVPLHRIRQVLKAGDRCQMPDARGRTEDGLRVTS